MADRKEQQSQDRESHLDTVREASMVPESFREDDNSIEVEFSAGALVRRYDWRADEIYMESLPLEGMDMRLLNSGAHFLDTHGRGGGLVSDKSPLASVLGSVVPGTARVEGGKAIARIKLSREEVDAPIVNKIKDGVIRKYSYGYDRQGDYTPSTDPVTGDKIRTWAVHVPNEISAVPVPADGLTDTRARQEPAPQEEPMSTPTIEPVATAITPVVDEAAQRAAVDAAVADATREAIAAEATRQADIRTAADLMGEPAESLDAMLADTSVTADAARIKMINARAEREKDSRTDSAQHAEASGQDESEKVREAVVGALIHRANPGTELPDASRDFRHRTLTDIAAACVRRAGGRPDGFSPMDVITAAMNQGGPCRIHSTSDFPLLLADVASKQLLNGYSQEQLDFLPISTRRDFKDFKPNYEVSLGGFSDLQLAPEGSGLTYGTMSEDGYNWSLASYRKGGSFTRQAMQNDDLGALTDTLARMGYAAVRLELDIWWAVVTANLMADGATDFLSTAHANITNSSGGVPSVAQIAKGKKILRNQTDVGATGPINLMPQYIVAPTDLEGGIDQLLSDQIRPAAAGDVVPGDVRGLKKIIQPRLDANSTKFWYLVANPMAWAGIKHGYLSGSAAPRLRTQDGWNVQGIEMQVEHDFAAAAVDHRPWYRNKGEA